MNAQIYRLVFDSCRRMLVPAAETARGRGGAAAGTTRARRRALRAGLAVAASLALALAPAVAAPPIPRAAVIPLPSQLPVRSTDPARIAQDLGRFSVAPMINGLRIDQQDTKAIINWDSFNVGAGRIVQFVQPDQGSTLNRIWDANPSVIFGRITANGEVLLQNANGVIFGPTARVDTGRFVATALAIANEAYLAGFRGTADGSAVFDGNSPDAFISIEHGAEIRAAAGGDVLIFAPRVVNDGRIETPGGQTVLGAGKTVYLAASADPMLRGLVIGIQPFSDDDPDINTVTQGTARSYYTRDGETVSDVTAGGAAGLQQRINAIVAEKGTINLIGLAIRQNGVLQATTAVKGENGAILLQAQKDLNPTGVEQLVLGQPVVYPQATALGRIELGAGSLTQVLPSSSRDDVQLDAETFNPSRVRIEGQQIHVRSGATVDAPSGRIELLASERPDASLAFNPSAGEFSGHENDQSRIVIESGARLNAAGLRDVEAPMSRNQASGRLFQIELANSPVQRNGVLYREEIFFDARNSPSIADTSGFTSSTLSRTAEEHSTGGGSISLQSDGAVAVDRGAVLDVSGGSIRYAPGALKTSMVRVGAIWVPIDQARPDIRYDELGNSKVRTDAGTALFKVSNVPGYVEGKDAGSISVSGRRVYFAPQLTAQTIIGPYQTGRNSVAVPAAGSFTLGRALDHTAFAVPAVTVQAADSERPAAFFADPDQGTIEEALPATVTVATQRLASGGIGHLALNTSGELVITEGTRVDAGVGGSFSATAGSAAVHGEVRAPGGDISIVAAGDSAAPHDIALGASAVLDTSGTWVDDTRLAQSNSGVAVQQVAVNGGAVSLSAATSLSAEEGARIDVSAGARRAASNALGRAGSIELAVNDGADVAKPLAGNLDHWNAKLAGYDFSDGGALSISGLPSLTLGGNGATDARFDAGFFNGGGFGAISLATLGGDLTVASGFDLSLQLANYLLSPPSLRPAAQSRFAAIGAPPDPTKRKAVSLTLNASTLPNPNAPEPVSGSSLVVEAGARIRTQAGGTLALRAGRDLVVSGALNAPGGVIDLSIAGLRGGPPTSGAPDDAIGFLPDQALWLTPTARLSTAGTEVSMTDRTGRRFGTVVGGGTVNLDAARGYVVAQEGAEIDVSGAAAELQLAATGNAQLVSRSAGAINASSPEGIVLDATLRAAAPNAQADGGSLNVALTLNGRDVVTSGTAYSTDPRTLTLAQDAAAQVQDLKPGDDLQQALSNGRATLSVRRIDDGGFANVTLKGDDAIAFEGNVQLSAPRSVVLDSRTLSAAGDARVSLQSTYVAIGDQRTTIATSVEKAPEAASGTAALMATAATIDVYGASALRGFGEVALNATLDEAGTTNRQNGEVRLIGTARGLENVATGELDFAGTLTVTAGQMYATTLSEFELTGLSGDSRLVTQQPAGGSTSATPYSALARLNVQADAIELNGVIRQPFGELDFKADRLRVGDGSITSVSADGLVIPVGTTVNGALWQYRPSGLYAPSGAARPVDATENSDIRSLTELPVAKAIRFDGQELVIADGARISASGSGDLQAWEFVAGVGGSSDYLASSGLYAVIPGYSAPVAPYDAEVANSGGSALRPGSTIDILSVGSGLAPGRYTLLPARYALLPGAFLVSVAPDQGGGPLQQAQVNPDGSVVVTGSFSGLGSSAASDAGTRVLVEAAATYLAKSRLDRASINTFLTEGAARLDQSRPTLPDDGGQVLLAGAKPFDFAAMLDLDNPNGGVRGRLDVATSDGRIAIVDDVKAAPADHQDGWTHLSAAALTQASAGSLLIGASRSAEGEVTVAATRVDMLARQGALAAGEVILAATEQVTLGAGTALNATGVTDAGARTLKVAGDSAIAIASGATGTSVLRSGASGATGTVVLGDGAVLDGQAVRLDGTRALQLSQSAEIRSEDVGITAARLAVGTPADAGDATVLDGRLLESLKQVASLTLGSSQGIEFHGSQSLNQQRLVLDTPTVRGVGSATDTVELNAQRIELRNTTAFAPGELGGGGSTLVVNATPPLSDVTSAGLVIGQTEQSGTGAIALDFGSSRLHTSGDAVFTGTGSLVSSGPLTVQAARVTATTGAAHGIDAGGTTLRIEQAADAATLGNAVGIGAALTFGAQRIEQAGRIEALGGTLAFSASGRSGETAIAFEAGSTTSAAGFAQKATDDWTVYGNAGRIEASAVAGDIVVAGRLDVSASGTGHAGSVALAATDVAGPAAGTVDLHGSAALAGGAAADRQQGSFAVDAGRLAHDGAATDRIDALAAALAAGGFAGDVGVRVRTGDLALEEATLRGAHVTLASDQGSIAIAGTIDARAATGGVVRVYGNGDVALAGNILASSSRAGANGGDVLLASSDGTVRVERTAGIDASGDDAADGRIVLRALRSDAEGTVAVDIADGFDSQAQMKAGEIDVEAVRRYTGYVSVGTGNTSGTRLGQNTLRANEQDFADNAGGVLAGLGLADDARAHLRGGIEIVASSNFTVLNDWNLWSENRPGNEPGFLTIRAAGTLAVNGSISDGFATAVRPGTTAFEPTELKPGDAWSYRLVGGADLQAADLMATRVGAEADLTVANTKLIRTTSGSIEMAAARDINLAPTSATTQQAVVYVAGRPSEVNDPTTLNEELLKSGTWTAQMTSHGGRVELAAGRDALGAPPNQLFGGWFYHVGVNTTPTAWWTAFDAFRQGVGSFGGGDARVTAGRDIRNVGVVAPTSALAAPPLPRGTTAAADQPQPEVENGGNVLVAAGRDIAGGSYFVGRGEGLLKAGRDVTVGTGGAAAVNRAPVLGVMDGRIDVEAGRSAQVAAAYNPTMAPQARRISENDAAMYLTYSPESSVSVRATAGDATWQSGDLTPFWVNLIPRNGDEGTTYVGAYQNLLFLVPPSLSMVALGGDAMLTVPSATRGLTLSPSPQGQLELYAADDLTLSAAAGSAAAWLYMSDQSPDSLPTTGNPYGTYDLTTGDPTAFLPRPMISSAYDSIHAGDTTPVRIHAGGDIELSRATGVARAALALPKAAQITAGGDIRNMAFVGQHLDANDVTTIRADGSIIQTAGAVNDRITLGGPGELVIEAGRQLDLGTSQGVETIGNLYNTALPADGAAIVLAAGMRGTLNAETFRASYLTPAAGSAVEQAGAFADQYLVALGADLANLTAGERELRASLATRYERYLTVQGVDNAAAVQARRNALVQAVRAALGFAPLPEAELPAAFDAAWAQFLTLSDATRTDFARRMLAQIFGATFLADGQPYAERWRAAAERADVDPANYGGAIFEQVRRGVLFDELNAVGGFAAVIPAASGDVRSQTYAIGFQAIDLAGMGASQQFAGDLDLFASGAQTLNGGGITLLAPGGQINVGLPGTSNTRGSGPKGVVVYGQGDLNALALGDFQVNSQKAFVIGQGNISVWSSQGDIDTGLGANTALLIPRVVPKRDAYGGLVFVLPSLAVGSGIGILDPAEGEANGDIGLSAPNGEVRALDAKIRAPGRITLAATVVRGADNISGGSVVGAPPAVSAPTTVGISTPTGAEAQANATAASAGRAQVRERDGVLTVELVGLGGDENPCPDGDEGEECRRKRAP